MGMSDTASHSVATIKLLSDLKSGQGQENIARLLVTADFLTTIKLIRFT